MSGRTEITIKTTSDKLAGQAINMAKKMKEDEEMMEEQEPVQGELPLDDEKCGSYKHGKEGECEDCEDEKPVMKGKKKKKKSVQDDTMSGGMEATPPVRDGEEEEEEGEKVMRPKKKPRRPMREGRQEMKNEAPSKKPMSGKVAPSHNDDGEPTTEGADENEDSKYMRGKGFSDVEARDFNSLQMKMLLGGHECMPCSMEFISNALRDQASSILGEKQATVGTFADVAIFVGAKSGTVTKFAWSGGDDGEYKIFDGVEVDQLHKSVGEIIVKAASGENEEEVVQRLAVKALSGDENAAVILKRAAGVCDISESSEHKTILEFFGN